MPRHLRQRGVDATTEVEVRIIEHHAQVKGALDSFELQRVHEALYVMAPGQKSSISIFVLTQALVNDLELIVVTSARLRPIFKSAHVTIWLSRDWRHLPMVYQLVGSDGRLLCSIQRAGLCWHFLHLFALFRQGFAFTHELGSAPAGLLLELAQVCGLFHRT